jgi:hypothetical protein
VELLQPHLKIDVLGILGDTDVSHTLILLKGRHHEVVFTDWRDIITANASTPTNFKVVKDPSLGGHGTPGLGVESRVHTLSKRVFIDLGEEPCLSQTIDGTIAWIL